MEKHEPSNERMSESDKRFYRGWVRDILMRVPDDISELKQFRTRFTVSPEDRAVMSSLMSVDDRSDVHEELQGIVNKIQQEIDERLAATIEDLRHHVFEPGLFKIDIVVEGQYFQVESLSVANEQVAPVVDGQVYTGPVDGVVFDL